MGLLAFPTRRLVAAGRSIFGPVGRYALLLFDAFSAPYEFPRYRFDLFKQMKEIGVASMPIVMLAAAFMGAVTTVQVDYQMDSPFLPKSTIGTVVTATVVLELGALITAFILSGRIGARIAAELGSMRVDEQIDALEVMGINAPGYLIVPRVLAGTCMFPLLYVVACIVGLVAGLLSGSLSGTLTVHEFIQGARVFFVPFDAFYGLTKATVFGFVLTSISCYIGYYASGGAEGVGRSATRAAVLSCVYILVADYMLATTLL